MSRDNHSHVLSYLLLTETWATLGEGLTPLPVEKTVSKEPFMVSKVAVSESGLSLRSCLDLPGTLVLSQCPWPLADVGDDCVGCGQGSWL